MKHVNKMKYLITNKYSSGHLSESKKARIKLEF